MPLACISRQVEVLSDNRLNRLPVRRDIRADTPRTGQSLRPRSRVSPTTYIDGYIAIAYLPDGFYDLRIACLLVQRQLLSGPAIVYLDKVEAATVEEKVCILFLVSIQPHTHTMRVFVPNRAASITAGIGIDPGLETLGVYIISNNLQAIRESFRMNLQIALFIPSVEKTVINIDIRITGFLQTLGGHGVSLPLNQIFADMDAVGIPRTPSHDRGQKRSFLGLQARRGKRIKQPAKYTQPPLINRF